MTERRRKLRARFRAVALEQLAQLTPVIDELRRGPAGTEVVRAVGRALHTLKGDAALVGLVEISSALHAAEDQAAAGAWDALAEALDLLSHTLARGDDDGGVPSGTIPPTPAGSGSPGPA